MASEYVPQLTPREPGPEDELDYDPSSEQPKLTPRAPTVSDIAIERQAAIANTPIPQTSGPGIVHGLSQSYLGQRATQMNAALDQFGRQQVSETIKQGQALAGVVRDPGVATRRLVTSMKEFMQAPGPWIMEAINRPEEDTPFTAGLSAAMEVAAASQAPLGSVFAEATRFAAEEAGLSQEEADHHAHRAALAAELIGGMVASVPGLKAMEGAMTGPSLAANRAYVRSKYGAPQAAAFRQRAAEMGLNQEMTDQAFDYLQNTPGEPMPKGFYPEEGPIPPGERPPIDVEFTQTDAQAARTGGGGARARAQAGQAALMPHVAEAEAAPVKAAVTTQAPAAPVKGPAPVAAATTAVSPEATIAPRENAGSWATLNARQGYTGAGDEPIRVGMLNGRPSLIMQDGSKLAEMTVEEATAYQKAGKANEVGLQQVILDDVAARVMAEIDNPAAKDSLDFPPPTPEELDAIERVTLFHGSRHLFDRFSSEKINTGERAQANTHGLYAAEEEGVARTYMTAGGGGGLFDGVELQEVYRHEVKHHAMQPAEHSAMVDLGRFSGNVEDALDFLDEQAGNLDYSESGKSYAESATIIRGWIKEGRLKPLEGHLYKTEIPKVHADHFLDLDLPLDKQPARVQAAFKEFGIEPTDRDLARVTSLDHEIQRVQKKLDDITAEWQAKGQPDSQLEILDVLTRGLDDLVKQREDARGMTGRKAYDRLAEQLAEPGAQGTRATGWGAFGGPHFGDEKAASAALNAKGIKGAKYLDQGSRGVGEGTRNYVIYDDSIIEITEIDGKPVKGKKAVNEPELKAQLDERREAIEPPDMTLVIDNEIKADRGSISADFADLVLEQEEDIAIREEGQTSIEDELARERGIDPTTGAPLATEAEVAADASRAAKKAKKGRKVKDPNRILSPSNQAFADTVGGTAIGSRAAAAKRTAVANAKWQARFERETPAGFIRLYQVDGQTFTSNLSEVVQTSDKIQWVDVPAEKAAKYRKGNRYTVPKSTAARSHPARLKPALAEVEVALEGAPAVETLRPAEPELVPRTEGPPVVRKPVAVAERPDVPAGLFEDVPRGTTVAPTRNVLDLLDMGEQTPPQSLGEVPLDKGPAADVVAGFEAQRQAAAAAKPGLGVVLPIRRSSPGDISFPSDVVTDLRGDKWTVMEADNENGILRVSRVLERGPEGEIVKQEDAIFHRDEVLTSLPIYDPVRGAGAIRLKDGTVVIGTRYTHNSAVVEAKAAGWGHLLSDKTGDVGNVVGEDQRFLTLDEYEQYKRANRIAKLEGGGPVDVVGTPGVAPPGAGGGGGEGGGGGGGTGGEGPFGNEGGFINLPKGKSPAQKQFDYLKSLGKGWRGAIADHGLKFTQWAAPDALDSINYSVGARGGSKFYIAHKLTQPIDRAIGKGGHERVLTALRDSNIQGAKDRWNAYVAMLGEMDDAAVLEMADNWGRDWFGLAVDHLFANQKNGPQMKGALTKAINQKDAANVRSMLSVMYGKAAQSIGPMPESSAAFIKSPEFWKAIEAAGEFFENLKNWNAEVGGHETHFTGPAGIYIPLTPFEASIEARSFGGMKAPFRRMRPGTTMHRTGLSGQYDASVEALARRVSMNIKAVGRNAATDALVETGVGVRLKGSEKPPPQMEAVRGVPEEVVVFQVTNPREVVMANGRISKIPGERLALPKSIAEELRPLYDGTRMLEEEAIERIQNALIKTFLRGWVEPMVHGQNVVAFLGKATAKWYPQALVRMFTTDLKSPEAIRQLQWMADHGALPNRYGSVSFSKELAAQFGAEHIQPITSLKGFLDLSPMLYGPNGMDIRARVAAAIYFDDMVESGEFKNVTALDKFRFLDQLGHYQAQTRTAWQKRVTHPLIQPFYTAAASRMRSALEVWGVGEPSVPMGGGRGGGGRGTLTPGARPFAEGPGGSGDLFTYRLKQHMKIGLLGGLAAWIAGHRALTGKWPWDDDDAKVFAYPVPKSWAQSAVGKYFVAEDARNKQSYIGIGGLFPIGYTILRLTGAQAAINTKLRGGNAAQMAEAALSQNIATMMQQYVGPALHIIQAAIPEAFPDILRFGKRGSGGLTFETQEKGKTLGPGVHVLERLKAGGKEVGVIGDIAVELAELAFKTAKEQKEHLKGTRQKALKGLANLILKQILSSPEDVSKTRERLRQERYKARYGRDSD